MPKKKSKTLTTRQQKLIKLVSENIGNPNGTKTMYEMMLEAGFKESTAKQQSGILGGVKQELQSIVQKLVDHREKVVERMQKTLPKAQYHNLVESLDKLTKNIQLLSGKPTDRTDLTLTDEQRRRIIRRETERFAG
ncbi:MAG: hypothetical protein NUV80_01080 [Candidatus Berkelbacteria bacterium]|nr:hypothetical protein [Candidatus Berkelbacteria bacterium]